MNQWLLLVYKVPREPTASRVYVWRKMKQLGAIALQDAVWVLPCTPRTQEQFQWLAAEITEMQGEALLWTAELTFDNRSESLIHQFQAQVDAGYQEILTALKRKNADLAALSRRYQQVQAQDYFQSKLGQRVREKLLSVRGGQEA